MAEFRTTIKKQIRKLSPTGPVSNKYDSDLLQLNNNPFDDVYASETEDSVFPMVMKSLSPPPAPPRRSSLSTTYSGEWTTTTASTATRESSPGAVAAVLDSGVASSAGTSKSVSPIPPFLLASSSSSAPQPIKKTPLPADSPLLSPRTASAGSSSHSRAKSLKRNLRRVRSMRAAGGRDCADGPVHSDCNVMGRSQLNGSNSSLRSDSSSGSSADYKEITLVVRRGSQLGRSGWKVMMAEDDEAGGGGCGDDLKNVLGDADLIDRVTASIRSMEFSGRKVPDRITVSCK